MKRLSLLALMLGFMLHAAAVGISANALVADKSIKNCTCLLCKTNIMAMCNHSTRLK
ncbi:hypothetical protein [Hoylesella shahii]|uniref:hypothetical protein n=1 Tax=Hoylesella shahii TaxID=228603 RepID=UPI001E2FF44F|nr:hypothetical protein [Hoylesella shahii]